MSHAAYHFLVDVSNAQDAKSQFEAWIEKHGDENNWSRPLYFVSNKGRVTYLSKDYREDDRRSAHERAQDLATLRSWTHARQFALACVITELNEAISFSRHTPKRNKAITESRQKHRSLLWHRREEIMSAFTYDQMLTRVQHRYANQIAWLIRHKPIPVEKEYSEHRFTEHMIDKALQTYAMLRKSIAMNCCPFTDDDGATPYTYRAFNLCHDHEKPGKGVLVVDIHT